MQHSPKQSWEHQEIKQGILKLLLRQSSDFITAVLQIEETSSYCEMSVAIETEAKTGECDNKDDTASQREFKIMKNIQADIF